MTARIVFRNFTARSCFCNFATKVLFLCVSGETAVSHAGGRSSCAPTSVSVFRRHSWMVLCASCLWTSTASVIVLYNPIT
jgi:hypothetical protein